MNFHKFEETPFTRSWMLKYLDQQEQRRFYPDALHWVPDRELFYYEVVADPERANEFQKNLERVQKLKEYLSKRYLVKPLAQPEEHKEPMKPWKSIILSSFMFIGGIVSIDVLLRVLIYGVKTVYSGFS